MMTPALSNAHPGSQISSWLFAAALAVSAVVLRWVPDAAGFSPLMAVSVVAGLSLPSRWMAILVPVAAMGLSDLVYGIDPTWWAVYGSLALVSGATWGFGQVARSSGLRFLLANTLGSGLGAVFFFLTTNLAVWGLTTYYPPTVHGLMTSYLAGVPFLLRGLLGDIFFAFGYSVAVWTAMGAVGLRVVQQNGGQKRSVA